MLRFYFNKTIIVAFIIALSILSWLAVASYLNNRNVIKAGNMVAHTLAVLFNTERVLATANNLELGQRGYTITHDKAFLKPYLAAKQGLDSAINNLALLTADNSDQQRRITDLRPVLDSLLVFSETAVVARDRNIDDAVEINASLRGKVLMDEVRRMVREIEAEENRLLTIRYRHTQVQLENFYLTFAGLLLATCLIVVGIFFTINYTLRSRIRTEAMLKSAMEEVTDLYDNAPCGYHSLDANGVIVNANTTFAAWLGYAKHEIIGRPFTDFLPDAELPFFKEGFRKFVETGRVSDVEFPMKTRDGSEFPVSISAVAIRDKDGNYVKSRSITFDYRERKASEMKIRNLNNELEAFTYSVSHDLRAPLRSIDGYAKILEEDYGDKFDEEGHRVLNVVLKNARRMGKLIDDLLDFARLGRKELLQTHVDMDALAKSVIRDQQEMESTHAEFQVAALVPCSGDADMLRQVWQNLISNAIKYSGKTDKPKIRIESSIAGNEIVYSVSDNGVGFDMAYAPKLFNVFQRLHKMEEFGGTGVGLAIVKRVIDRHGGRVWADSTLNAGATFYFTIPNEHAK